MQIRLRGALSTNRQWLALGALAIAAVMVTNEADLRAESFRVLLLNANWELSWSHDADTMILAGGVFAAAFAYRRADSRERLWGATALILGLFLVDEVSPLHSEIGVIPFGKILYTPILLGLVTCLWLLSAGSEERPIMTIGLATLSVAFGMHVIGLHVLRPLGYYTRLYQAGVGFKEGTELAGMVLLVPALARLTAREPSRIPGGAGGSAADSHRPSVSEL